MSSDKHLIRAIKGGDTKSFDELFEKYYDRYFSFACALLHDENAAEDVLQNVFLKIWIGRDRLDETRNLESYLLVSVRNEIFDHLRLVCAAVAVKFCQLHRGAYICQPQEIHALHNAPVLHIQTGDDALGDHAPTS